MRSAATTAYGGEGRAKLDAGYLELQDIIKKSTIKGVTRDQTLDAYTSLAATGQFKPGEIKALLPSILRGALAGDAGTGDMVQLASSIKNSGITDPKKIETMLSKYLMGGMKGQFELRDSAKAAPRLLQKMTALGYSPEQANQELIVMLQQARQGAGTNDAAAVNVENFLSKMQADSTRKDFQKQGVDLEKEKAIGRMQGKNPLEIYFGALDKVIAKADPKGRANALLSKYKDADPEKRAALNTDLQQIFENTAVSKIVGDMQEYSAYAAIKNNKTYGAEVRSAVGAEQGQTLAESYAFRAESVGSSQTAAANAKDNAMFETMRNSSGALKGVYDGFSSIANAAPSLTGATIAATTALTAFASVAGIATLALGGKGLGVGAVLGKGAGLVRKIPGVGGFAAGVKSAVAAAAPLKAAAGLSPVVATGAKLLRGGGPVGLLATGASIAIDTLAPSSKAGQYASTALSGAALGATVGSVVPVIGTAIGAGLGALGGLAVQAIEDALAKAQPSAVAGGAGHAQAAQAAQTAPEPLPPQTLQATVKVDMSPDLRAQLAQIKATQQVQATIQAGNASHHPAIALRGSIYGGL